MSLRSSDVKSSRQSANVPNDGVNAAPECESPKFKTGVKADIKDRRVDQTRPRSPTRGRPVWSEDGSGGLDPDRARVPRPSRG